MGPLRPDDAKTQSRPHRRKFLCGRLFSCAKAFGSAAGGPRHKLSLQAPEKRGAQGRAVFRSAPFVLRKPSAPPPEVRVTNFRFKHQRGRGRKSMLKNQQGLFRQKGGPFTGVGADGAGKGIFDASHRLPEKVLTAPELTAMALHPAAVPNTESAPSRRSPGRSDGPESKTPPAGKSGRPPRSFDMPSGSARRIPVWHGRAALSRFPLSVRTHPQKAPRPFCRSGRGIPESARRFLRRTPPPAREGFLPHQNIPPSSCGE